MLSTYVYYPLGEKARKDVFYQLPRSLKGVEKNILKPSTFCRLYLIQTYVHDRQ